MSSLRDAEAKQIVSARETQVKTEAKTKHKQKKQQKEIMFRLRIKSESRIL